MEGRSRSCRPRQARHPVSWRPCLRCGTLIGGSGSYCSQHRPRRPSRQTAGRGGGWAASKFRKAVLARAGYRCEAMVGGLRCEVLEGLEAHHWRALANGGSNDPSNGVCLCRKHHRLAESAQSGSRQL